METEPRLPWGLHVGSTWVSSSSLEETPSRHCRATRTWRPSRQEHLHDPVLPHATRSPMEATPSSLQGDHRLPFPPALRRACSAWSPAVSPSCSLGICLSLILGPLGAPAFCCHVARGRAVSAAGALALTPGAEFQKAVLGTACSLKAPWKPQAEGLAADVRVGWSLAPALVSSLPSIRSLETD